MLFSPQILVRSRQVAVTTSFDAATIAWVNAVVADGGAVSATQKTRVDNLIVALKGHSLFTVLQRLWLYGGESDAHQAKIDIINLAAHTLNGSPALAAGGYTGNGSSDYIDTGYNPSVSGSLDSHSFGTYIRGTTTGNIAEMGVTFSAKASRLIPAFGGNTYVFEINATTQDTGTNTNEQGFFILSRTGATANGYYRNGSSIATSATVSNTLPNANMFALAENSEGSAANFSPNQQAAVFIGGGLDATQAANLTTDLEAYMDAWGIGVI